MGFVDDDQPRGGQRRKDGGAGADDDACLAVTGGQPVVQTFPIGETGVQGRHRHGEALAETLYGLGRQADFRNQHQYLLAGGQMRSHGLQVDFGLAAAGNAVKEEGGEAPGLLQSADRLALLRVGGQWRLGQNVPGGRTVLLCYLFRPAFVAQTGQGGGGYIQGRQHGAAQAFGVVAQGVQGLALSRGAAELVVTDMLPAFGNLPAFFLAGLGIIALAQQGRQGITEHFAQWVVVVASRPFA